MSKFKVGDKVRAIKDQQIPGLPFGGLMKGQVYTVEGFPHFPENGFWTKEHGQKAGWWFDSKFELVEEVATDKHMEERHVYHDLIIAWAKGAKIQCKPKKPYRPIDWADISRPAWIEDFDYRIKPEPKPDYEKSAYIPKIESGVNNVSVSIGYRYAADNVKFTFDGETNVLKSVELIS